MISLLSQTYQRITGKPTEGTFDFHGGISLPTNKRALANGIDTIATPTILVLPLSNYTKQLVHPFVQLGETVLRGQLIADNIIAPTSGTIKAIEDQETIHPDGLKVPSIILESDGFDRSINDNSDRAQAVLNNLVTAFANNDRETATTILNQFGLAGLGGAGFPTASKLLSALGNIHTIIINAAECEPEIACDEALMQAEPRAIAQGINALQQILPHTKIFFAIEDSKPDALNCMVAALDEQGKTKDEQGKTNALLKVIPTRYPTGAESTLIKTITGKHIPHTQKPSDHGILCLNVGTVYALWKALNNEPLDSRIVSLGGQSMPRPCNVRVRFGTSIRFILESTGNETVIEHCRIRAGGPLSGFDIDNLSTPINAKTNCLLAEPLIEPEPAQACIRCGLCADVCPAHLLPQQLHWHAMADEFSRCERLDLNACIECGCCDLVCPASIKLTETFRYAKSEISFAALQKQKASDAEQRFAVREIREAQRKVDKAAAIEKRKQSIKTNAQSNAENIKAALDRARAKRQPKKSE